MGAEGDEIIRYQRQWQLNPAADTPYLKDHKVGHNAGPMKEHRGSHRVQQRNQVESSGTEWPNGCAGPGRGRIGVKRVEIHGYTYYNS